MTDTLEELTQKTRTYSDWSSTKGFRTDALPWRLWDKAKRLHWDPAAIDFTQDAKDWAFLEASVTYNQFIEGCLAIAGYRMWGQMFDAFGVLPGLREGIGHIQDDERRHIAYGTYLCRRIIAADHSLVDFAVDKMYELRGLYAQGFPGL